MFRAKGYDGATVSEIVLEAGVAQGTFYLYFPSKRDAAVSLRTGLMEDMAQAITTAVESCTSFEDRLEALIAATFKVARKNMDLFSLAFIGADETHSKMPSAPLEHALPLRVITDLFRDAVDAGEMEGMDPEIAARLALGLLRQSVIEAYVFSDAEESNRIEQGVSALLLNALVRRTG
ncbi:MAG: helix-turn-helix transcriptional regulator [SAR324 cluster bacterium]|nr:helix-turn-helix transcriptional regulator [SAR324 cluster bacterium]